MERCAPDLTLSFGFCLYFPLWLFFNFFNKCGPPHKYEHIYLFASRILKSVFVFLILLFLKSIFVVFYEIVYKRKYDKIRLQKRTSLLDFCSQIIITTKPKTKSQICGIVWYNFCVQRKREREGDQRKWSPLFKNCVTRLIRGRKSISVTHNILYHNLPTYFLLADMIGWIFPDIINN